tara:strand:- start:235 stop:1332 length:1098 start_codon:yes stop_codon:yes gene_type:complete
MMFSEGIGAGFRDVSFMLMQSVMEMDKAENQPLLTKEDWEASKFYDPEIKWDESFTTPKARLLKERRDRERELGFLLERAGAGATASFYAGALVGTVPDPVNYIPFVGIASKAKSAAVLGKIAQSGRLGRGATTAADAVLGTALIQPLVAAERDTYQLKYDTRDALTELGLALGLGFGLGAALGRVHPKDPDPTVRAQEGTVSVNRKGDIEIKEGRAPDPETPSTRAAANIAPQDAKTAIDVAAAQQAAGESINVGKFAPTQPVRQTADGAAAPEVTPAEVWQSDIPRTPEPTPVPDPTPISQNQAQLDAADARASERIAQLENSDKPLTEEEARVLALDDEDVRRNDTFVEATNAAVECMIANA